MQIETRNDFGKILIEKNLSGIGVEIGVASGSYSEVLLKHTPLKKIYLVDPWRDYLNVNAADYYGNQKEQDKRYDEVVNKFKCYADRVVILRKESIEASKDFANEYFDFIYIDANHSYEFVKEDIEKWYPKLKSNGVMSGHDYLVNNRGRDGVKIAVDEFCFGLKLKLYVTGGTRRCPPSWYFLK
jgi:hypothetical protein